jgi:FkbM family methyltransferase
LVDLGLSVKMSLKSELSFNYLRHPAFRGVQTWAEPDENLLNKFSGLYQQLSKSAARLSSRELSKIVGQALICIEQVFQTLTLQIEDTYEGLFLTELEAAVKGLFQNEVAYFVEANRDAMSSLAHGGSSSGRFELGHSSRYGFGKLHRSVTEEILSVGGKYLQLFRENAAQGLTTREHLSVNTGPEVDAIKEILHREFTRTGVLQAVGGYAGRKMRVYGVAFELSVPVSTWWRHVFAEPIKAPQTLYAHLDESIEHPKAIVYLTDVADVNGPTSCYPGIYEQLGLNPLQELIGRIVNTVGNTENSPLKDYYKKAYHQSMSSENFRRHFMRLPESLRFNSHLGWDVLAGSPTEASFKRVEQCMLGEAGTFIAFDGAKLFHRGGLISAGERVALQVVFSEIPSPPPLRGIAGIKHGITQQLRRWLPTPIKQRLKRVLGRANAPNKAKEPSATEALSLCMPEVICVDVGASYFPHTAWGLFLRSPNTHWLAVEPNLKNLEYIDHWPHASRVRKMPFGLSREGGLQTLYVTNVDSGSSLLEPDLNVNVAHRLPDTGYFFPLKPVQVCTITLSEVIGKIGVDAPIFVKLDTQGTELDILKGAQLYFENNAVIGIELESTMQSRPFMRGAGKFWEACQYLEDQGFELLGIKPIEFQSVFGETGREGKRVLNECDAIFALRRDIIKELPTEHRLALFGFYLTNEFFEEALSLFKTDHLLSASLQNHGLTRDYMLHELQSLIIS